MAITKLIADSITSGAIANSPAFLAYRTAQQNLSNGATTKCEYNVELFDTDNCYDNSTNYRFTPTTAGKYYIFHNSIYGRDTSNVWDYGNIYIYKNGSFIAIQGASTTSAQNVWYQTVSTIADMNGSSDYIEAYINNYVSSGTPRIGGGLQYSQFGAYRIIE